MKVKFSDLPVGSCFCRSRSRRMEKKTGDGEIAYAMKGRKAKLRREAGDPEVAPKPCPLRMIGVGLRRHPDAVVEIGDGRPFNRRK